MSDPQRWRSPSSDAPSGARELLLAARPAPPLPPELRAASADAVRALADHGTSSALLGPATAKLSLAIVGAIAGAALWWGLTPRTPVEEVRPAPQNAPARIEPTAAPPTAAPMPPTVAPSPTVAPMPPAAASPTVAPVSPTVASPSAAPSASASRPAAARPPPRVAPPAPLATPASPSLPAPGDSQPDRDSLAREAAILEAARASLALAPEKTLFETDRHQAEFPAGQLSAEREVLAIDALGRVGRHPEAEQRAEAFLAGNPQPVLKERVIRILKRNRAVDSVKGR